MMFFIPFGMGVASTLLALIVLKLYRQWRYRRARRRWAEDFNRIYPIWGERS